MLHQIDVWAYELVVGSWQIYWPTLLFVLALTPLERLLPIDPGQAWRPWFFNLGWHMVYAVVTVLSTWGLWWQLVHWLTKLSGGPLFRLPPPVDGWGLAWRVALFMLVFDFFSYWWHRAMHAWPVLWTIHQFHHDEEHMNASTSFRSHWLNVPFNQLVIQVPMLWLFGIQSMSPGVMLVMVAFAAFTHSNLRIDLGPLTGWIVGPLLHRVHHDRVRALSDRNLATFFPVWDRLFGTFEPPTRGALRPLGVEGMETTLSFWQASVQPIVDLAQQWRGAMARPRDPM